MDNERKRALKKAGKAAIAEESQKLREILAKTNRAPFASDTYVQNAIEIHKEEIQMRDDPQRVSIDEINRRFLVKPYSFDTLGNYPLGYNVFWFCPQCDYAVPSVPRNRMQCKCGNLSVGFPKWKRLVARLVCAKKGSFLRARLNYVGWRELVVKGETKIVAVNLFPERR